MKLITMVALSLAVLGILFFLDCKYKAKENLIQFDPAKIHPASLHSNSS